MKTISLLLFIPVSLAAQYRIVYPLSVVPGGIDAATVNEHITKYENFYRPAVLRHGKYYLEYSQNGVTAWTQKPKEIPQGSDVFVNNRGEIKRSRCGNGISCVPRLPHLTAPLPPNTVLETPRIVDVTPPDVIPPHLPLIAHLLPPDLPIFVSRPDAPPEFPEIIPPYIGRGWIPPAVGIPIGLIPVLIPPPVLTAVPEPAYGGIILGLAICAAIFWLARKTKLKDTDKND